MRELAPGVARIALLVTTSDEPLTTITVRDAQNAARAMGLQIEVHVTLRNGFHMSITASSILPVGEDFQGFEAMLLEDRGAW